MKWALTQEITQMLQEIFMEVQETWVGVQETWLFIQETKTDTGDDLRMYHFGQKYQYFQFSPIQETNHFAKEMVN